MCQGFSLRMYLCLQMKQHIVPRKIILMRHKQTEQECK